MMDEFEGKFSLRGKVALIAGASRAIGEGIASVYARAGAKIVACSRKPKAIEEAGERIRSRGGKVLAVAANVSSGEDRKKMVQAAMDWAGRIDILVNNAGANPMITSLGGIPESVWDKIFEVNVKAPLILSQLVYQAWMRDHGGTILNVSSVAGFKTSISAPAYNISKGALIHLTQCLAAEWGPCGIRVNALAPGFIKTEFSRRFWESPAWEGFLRSCPLGRIRMVQDIEAAALLLASEASSFITGHILVIDGGELIKAENKS